MPDVPDSRIRPVNDQPVRTDGAFVLYWMTAFRRTAWNYALQRAVEQAVALRRPLVVLEALRCDYPWASDRLHRFILQGMADNRKSLRQRPALYVPYVEPTLGAGKGLLAALADHACLVVADDYPGFFLPRMVAAAAVRVPVRLEAVDANGLLPLRAAERAYPTAHGFRRFLQKELPGHLLVPPRPDPLAGVELPRLATLPAAITGRWPPAAAELLAAGAAALSHLPIDHAVGAVSTPGGSRAADERLEHFLAELLPFYPEKRNEPEAEATSGLSPYLHFGHISSHQVFAAVASRYGWSIDRLAPETRGQRRGWWGMSEAAEAFLDQLVTWRELGFNTCARGAGYDRFEALPEWARTTLEGHAGDPRPYLYTLEEFAAGRTHDRLWNAAQMQLAREGRLHNYLRMLWGKKILEWTPSPRQALEVMVELNNRFALDGRDPNSWSGIFWCLGRYDRPWGPERPIFGKVRYMSSESTARKVEVRGYLQKYAP